MTSAVIDVASFDCSTDVLSQEELRRLVPHDHEFRLLDGICYLDREEGLAIGYKEWDDNPWWAKGHIPGRPLMPGVLMVEGCAQVATVLMKTKTNGWDPDTFIGMGGIDKARFRKSVSPPARVLFVARAGKQSRKIAKFATACYVEGDITVEMEMVGVHL